MSGESPGGGDASKPTRAPTRAEVERLLRECHREILVIVDRFRLSEEDAAHVMKGASLKLLLTPSRPAARRALLLRSVESQAREVWARTSPTLEPADDPVH